MPVFTPRLSGLINRACCARHCRYCFETLPKLFFFFTSGKSFIPSIMIAGLGSQFLLGCSRLCTIFLGCCQNQHPCRHGPRTVARDSEELCILLVRVQHIGWCHRRNGDSHGEVMTSFFCFAIIDHNACGFEVWRHVRMPRN